MGICLIIFLLLMFRNNCRNIYYKVKIESLHPNIQFFTGAFAPYLQIACNRTNKIAFEYPFKIISSVHEYLNHLKKVQNRQSVVGYGSLAGASAHLIK